MQITLNELLETQETQKTLIDCILNGRIIIYPTDTVYGIGCDATNNKAVERLRHMKQTKHPLSVIAPSMTWISDNFTIKHEEFLSELPGKITLILEKKNKTFLKHCSETTKLGIRIPEHPITKIIQKTGKPFITTSANMSGKPVITKTSMIKDLKPDIIIDGGELSSQPSKILDLTDEKPKTIR